MLVAFESLRFYKLKNENTARMLFLILYGLYLAFYSFPVGSSFSIEFLMDSLQGDPREIYREFSTGHLLHYSVIVLFTLVTSFISLVYANCHVMESENFPNKKGVMSSMFKLPQLVLLVLLMVPLLFLSSFFLFIPFIFIYYSLFFAPLLITEGKKSVSESIIESFTATRGYKFSIFFTHITIYFIMNIPTSIAAAVFISTGYHDTLAQFLVMSFLRAAYILMTGRMLGNFYMLIVKNIDKTKRVKLDFFGYPGGADNETSDDESDDESDEENKPES